MREEVLEWENFKELAPAGTIGYFEATRILKGDHMNSMWLPDGTSIMIFTIRLVVIYWEFEYLLLPHITLEIASLIFLQTYLKLMSFDLYKYSKFFL